MKFCSILFMLIISSRLMYGQCDQNSQITQGQPGQPTVINITLNTANQASLNQKNDLNQEANHFSTQNTDVTTKVITKPDTDLQQRLYDFYQQQSKKVQDSSTSAIAWIKSNKLKSIGVGLLIFYSYFSYKIYQANLIISDPNSWSNWHNSKSLDDLFAIPHNRLESDLLFAIQTRYVHPINPTDFIYSLVQSSISLNLEMQILQDQISRYKWLESCQCMTLFFIDTQELATLQDKHRKLSFIKHIFASWCANYKIDKNS